jgi:predicted nucleic acid-binding protein
MRDFVVHRQIPHSSGWRYLAVRCSQKLTEQRIDQLQALIRTHLNPGCSISILGANQLTHLADQHPDILHRHYQAELRTIEANLLAFQSGPEKTETKGLRLALIAFGSDDATALRRNISRRAILEALRQVPCGATEEQIAKRLSDDLRLPRTLDCQYVRKVLEEIRTMKAAAEAKGVWTITPAGTQESESVPTEAAEGLLRGRAIIRRALEELTGRHLTDQQFESIWSTLLDFLTELFYSNGIAIITAINEFLSGAEGAAEQSDLEKLIQQGASRIGATFAIPEMGSEFEQAIKDIFTERSGQAFEWLAHICERFIALCALGLETSSAAEILAALRRYELVLDSDVVLTILCEGEPDHKALREILARFRRSGGKILVSSPVLEEVAYHAHISNKDFNRTLPLLGKLQPEEIRRYTDNAFVRAFHTVSKNAKHWQAYRSQFVGTSSRDYTKILEILQSELMVGILPPNHDPPLARNITKYLQEIGGQTGKPNDYYDSPDIGKTGRDGQVLASIATARATARRAGAQENTILLSSSSRLRKASRKFREQLATIRKADLPGSGRAAHKRYAVTPGLCMHGVARLTTEPASRSCSSLTDRPILH